MTLKLYTSEQLIESVRSHASIGTEGVDGSDDATILGFLNEEMYTLLVPGLMRTREDYLVVSERFDLSATESRYRVPSRAVGQKLRDIHHVSADGVRTRIERMSRADLELYNSVEAQRPSYYYLEGSWVVLVGSGFTGSLELSYHMRPGELVLVGDYRKVVSLTEGEEGTQITLDGAAPPAIGTTLRMDVHGDLSGADLKEWDVVCDEVVSTQVGASRFLDGSVFGRTAIAVGDYVCAAGQAAIPGLPRELHPILSIAAAVRLRESLGDTEGANLLRRTLTERLQAAEFLVTDRMESRPPRLINKTTPLWPTGRTGRW